MSAMIEHGYLPAGKYIINHDIMNCTADGVVANHLYSGRALGLSEPWDIIQLHPDLKALWPDIHQHYQRIDLRHSDNVIWDLDLKQLGAHIGHQPSVFYFGPDECQYWGDQEWMNTVEYINSKNNFMSLAQELGIDVPVTLCFDNVAAIDEQSMQDMVYPCYLKAAISVSGVGIYRCQDEQAFKQAITKFDADVPVQVQEEVITDTFLNMQYRVIGKDVVRLAASEQILDGFVHQGNRVPASHEPWEAVDAMAHWLKDHGMKGVFAFDVAIAQTDKGLRFPAIECNPRFNGASYPTMIAQKLDIAEWSAISVSTQYHSLSDIDLSGIEFDRKTGEGVIIVNWGTVLAGKLVMLLAGDSDIQAKLEVELASRL
ncbi:MAG: ATP-grasp domain-containing protein [Gammaproteobacteria bacterium]